jgi:hypothetical protein
LALRAACRLAARLDFFFATVLRFFRVTAADFFFAFAVDFLRAFRAIGSPQGSLGFPATT